MIRKLIVAIIGGFPVIVGRAERICAPGRYAVAAIRKTAANTYTLAGDLI